METPGERDVPDLSKVNNALAWVVVCLAVVLLVTAQLK